MKSASPSPSTQVRSFAELRLPARGVRPAFQVAVAGAVQSVDSIHWARPTVAGSIVRTTERYDGCSAQSASCWNIALSRSLGSTLSGRASDRAGSPALAPNAAAISGPCSPPWTAWPCALSGDLDGASADRPQPAAPVQRRCSADSPGERSSASRSSRREPTRPPPESSPTTPAGPRPRLPSGGTCATRGSRRRASWPRCSSAPRSP